MTRTRYLKLLDELNQEFGVKKTWREHVEELQAWVQKSVEESKLRMAFGDV